MKTLTTNENNDIFIGADNKLSVSTDIEAVLNICANYAKTGRGEMIADMQNGMPFFESVFGARPDMQVFEAWFRKRMLQVNGVISVLSFEGVTNSNTLSYNATIKTIYGEGQING